MNKRSLGLLLSGILLAGVTALVAPGCGHSLYGDCVKICRSSCEAADDCEEYFGGLGNTDREECLADCDPDCDRNMRDFQDECEDNDDVVVIDGAQVDRCNDAIQRLGEFCRADDESEIGEAAGDVSDECYDADHPLAECR